MATVLQDDDEEQQQQGSAAPVVTSGQGAGPISSTGGGAQQQQPGAQAAGQPKGTSSGRFTNIQKYLSANTKADYANQIGQKQEEGASAVRQGIEASKQQASQQANPEIQRLQQAGQVTQQALDNPEQFTQNQGNLDAFNKIRQGQYLQGVGLQNEAQLANQAQDVQNRANMAGTEQGRFQLLRDQFGQQPGKTYSSGQQRLDQLLLQGKSGQLGQLAQRSQAAATGTEQALAQARGETAGLTQQLQNLGKSAQQQAQEALTGKIGETKTGLEQRATQTQSDREAQFEALRGSLEKGELTESQAQSLGLDPNDENSLRLYGSNPLEFLNKNALGQVGVGQVANDQDRARLAALGQLSGQQELSQFAAPGEALKGVESTFGTDLLKQQQAAGQARIGDIQSQFQQQRAPVDQKVHDLMRNATGNWLGEGAAGRDRMANMSPGELANELMKKNSDGRNSMTAAQIEQYNTQSDVPGSPGYDLRQAQKQRQAVLGQEAAAKDAAGYNKLLKILRPQAAGAV